MSLLEALPEFAAELAGGLREAGHFRLAGEVAQLTLADRCRCDEDFCATFYTVPKTALPPYGEVEEFVALARGVMCVQVARERIVCVEVLYRPDVRDKLREVLP